MRRFLFLWGVVLSAFLLSCSKETPLPSTEAEETIYQKVGRIHNEALDYVLDYIKRNKGSIMTRSGQSLSKDDIISMAEPALKEYFKTSSESVKFGSVTRVSEDELSFDFSGLNTSEMRESLNDTNKVYYDRFVSIIDSDEACNWKLSSLSGLVSEINDDNSLDQLSKESLLYLVEVGTSSLKYWTEKIQEWCMVLSGIDTPSTRGVGSEVYAQGCVVNMHDQPLSGIMVRVQDKCLFDWTDAQGEYGLWCKISDMIVISADGYQTLSIPGEVYLNPEPPKAILWPEQGGHFYLREMIIADASVAMAGAIESALGIAASAAITGGGSLFVLAGPAVSASLLAAVGFALHDIATE